MWMLSWRPRQCLKWWKICRGGWWRGSKEEICGGKWFEAHCYSHLPSPWTKVLVIIRGNCEARWGPASLGSLICILPMRLPGQRVQCTAGRRGWAGHGEGTHPFPWKWIFVPLFCRGYDCCWLGGKICLNGPPSPLARGVMWPNKVTIQAAAWSKGGWVGVCWLPPWCHTGPVWKQGRAISRLIFERL